MITNLRYADDIILLATSEAELQELVDRLVRVNRKYSLLINVDKTKVMATDGIACRILIQNELLEQVDTFPYLGSLITEDGECMTEFRTRKQGSCLEKEIMQGTMPGARRRGRPRTSWMDNVKTWTGLSVEESIRMTEDRDKWRKYVHGVANPRIEDG